CGLKLSHHAGYPLPRTSPVQLAANPLEKASFSENCARADVIRHIVPPDRLNVFVGLGVLIESAGSGVPAVLGVDDLDRLLFAAAGPVVNGLCAQKASSHGRSGYDRKVVEVIVRATFEEHEGAEG